MEIQTKTMGTVQITEEQIITLAEGFYGFEEFHKYALLDSEQEPFIWVQSLEDKNLAFIAIDPFIFRPDYELDISDDILKPIEVESPTDLLVFALVTIPPGGNPITANLQGPLIINKKNKKGLQAVMNDGKWNTKHDILAELNAAGRK
ncbi:flagellar assembly protein FliW [Treponema pedis]|nr:flagellar assembly protein FliW [Treponema pedis]QSI05367.1 flagellar assembly protein FliW [Treponema pedis]